MMDDTRILRGNNHDDSVVINCLFKTNVVLYNKHNSYHMSQLKYFAFLFSSL